MEGTKEKERADRRVPRARREERCMEAVHTRRMFGREGRVGVGYERQRRKRIADFRAYIRSTISIIPAYARAISIALNPSSPVWMVATAWMCANVPFASYLFVGKYGRDSNNGVKVVQNVSMTK